MFPTICQIGPLTIYSYGLMLAIAIIVCTLLLCRDAKPHNIKSEVIFDLVFWLVIAGILGARVFFVLLNIAFFLEYPVEIIMIQNGGLAWQGGLIAGIASGLWYTKRHNLPILKMLDLSAPYLALGQSIGRIGCFLNGCCYGHPSNFGIYFPVHNAKLHPTQLYDTIGLFLIFLILKYRQRAKKHFSGTTFISYLILASTLRFAIEFLRADHTTLWLNLSIYQLICLTIILTSIIIYGRSRKSLRNNLT